MQLQTPVGAVPGLADTGAEGLFISSSLAARLTAAGTGRMLRLVGFCGEQQVEQRSYAGLALSGEPAPRSGSTTQGGRRPIEAIITTNPIFAALGVQAIVGQELLRGRRQLWRLDQQPPRLELY